MNTWGRRIVVAFFVVIVAAMGVTYILKLRADADRESVRESLRQLGQYALTTRTDDRAPRSQRDAIPPATLVNPMLAVDLRLSWVVDAFPQLDQRRQKFDELLMQIQPTQPWNAETHTSVSRIPIRMLWCPANRRRRTPLNLRSRNWSALQAWAMPPDHSHSIRRTRAHFATTAPRQWRVSPTA